MAELYKKQLSDKVLGMAFSVHNILGPGLLESAYEGGYIADLVVDNTIILELKSVKQLNNVMRAQLINYLHLSGVPIGYLINFYNTSVQWQRFINKRE